MTLSKDAPFEEYLKDVYLIDSTGFSELIFEAWLETMTPMDWLRHGNNFGQLLMNKIK